MFPSPTRSPRAARPIVRAAAHALTPAVRRAGAVLRPFAAPVLAAALAAGVAACDAELPPTAMTLLDARVAAPGALGSDDERSNGLSIVAPPVVVGGDAALGAVARATTDSLTARLRASDSVRLVPRAPTDTVAGEGEQVLRALRRADAQVAVGTTYYRVGDSVRVQVTLARRVPPLPFGTRVARRFGGIAEREAQARKALGDLPPRAAESLETVTLTTVAAPLADAGALAAAVGVPVERALVSMTRCTPRPAASRDAAPWCWTGRGKTRPVARAVGTPATLFTPGGR